MRLWNWIIAQLHAKRQERESHNRHRDRAPSRLSPPGSLSPIPAPPGFLGGAACQGLHELPILCALPRSLDDLAGIIRLWIKPHRTPQMLYHAHALFGPQCLPLLQRIQPGAVVGVGVCGIQIRGELHQVLRPLGCAVGMLCKLSNDIREVLPSEAIGCGDWEAMLRYPCREPCRVV